MADSRRPSWLNTLGWAAYVACSWTWCIGMFLPVLLIRDFGWWSFAVFAIPNCVGAAAFGWVVSRPQTSAALVSFHNKAVSAFSIVTVVFQAFFMYSITIFPLSAHALVPLGAVAFGGLLARGKRLSGKAIIGASATFMVSLGLLAWFLVRCGGAVHMPPRISDPQGLAYLAPVCIFGFALSPYLDGTFHRAARDHGVSIPMRFGLGFLFLFPFMIGFTLLYAGSLLMDAAPRAMGTVVPSLAATPVLIHIGIQLGYTLGLHGSVLASGIEPKDPASVSPRLLVALVGVATALGWLSSASAQHMETIYRLFMSFYGLIFPAYVWICMIPTLGAPAKPTRRQLVVFGASIALAAPFYWLGFIEMRYWALAPGVLIPLVARLGIGKTGRSEIPTR